jgi:hypothetical protein
VPQLFCLAALMLSSKSETSLASDVEQSIKQARSIIAESALAIELLEEGKLTDCFVRGLLEDAKEQLDSVIASGRVSSPIVAELKAAKSAINSHSAAPLNELAGSLYRIERQNE